MCSSIHGAQQEEGSSSAADVRSRISRVNNANNGAAVRRSAASRSDPGMATTTTTTPPPNITTSATDRARIQNLKSKRRRTIYVFYFMAFLDLLAVSLFLPLLASQMRDLGATHIMTGLVSSAYGAIQLISSPVMGWGSDIYGQKLILISCLLLSGFAYFIQGLAINITMMLISRVVTGIFKHTQTIGKSIVSDLSSKDKSYVIGNFNAFGSMGFILGPTLGAHIGQMENGFQMVSFICAGAFLLNTVLLIVLVPEPSSITPRNKSLESSQNGNEEKGQKNEQEKRAFLTDFYSIILLAVRFLFSFATLVFRENLVMVLQDKYDTSLVNAGYLTSLQALMSTVMGFAVGPVNAFIYKGNSLYMVLISGILKAVVLLTLFWSPSFWLAGTMLVAVSALNPFLRVGITTVALEGHENEVGTILGFSQSATSLARMISPTAAGIAMSMSTDGDGPFLVAAVSAVCGIFATLLAQRFSKQRKDEHPKAD